MSDLDLRYHPPRALSPDHKGFYGSYGGRYVAEVLWPNLEQLTSIFHDCIRDPDLWQSYYAELVSFSGRPTPLTYLKNLSRELGGARLYLKREDLNQTGAHKICNVIGQGLLCQKLGKSRVIAETGAGQHGIATATMAARMGLKARIYMGAEDVNRQRPNVFWMERLGAEVVAVTAGTQTLKDAINEALRDWSANFEDTHYVLGTACGPHPFPELVAYFASVIGLEASQQISQKASRLPDRIYACVGGGSNAIGFFQGFLDQPQTECIGVEAGGKGLALGEHASRLAGEGGTEGIAQGYRSVFLQNDDGQMVDTHSVAAGLDYVGVSPIIADLARQGKVRMERASDYEVISAAQLLMQHEGIIPALESSHALAAMFREAQQMDKDQIVVGNLSGRGDKDIFTIAEAFDDESWQKFLQQKAKEQA